MAFISKYQQYDSWNLQPNSFERLNPHPVAVEAVDSVYVFFYNRRYLPRGQDPKISPYSARERIVS